MYTVLYEYYIHVKVHVHVHVKVHVHVQVYVYYIFKETVSLILMYTVTKKEQVIKESTKLHCILNF